LADRRGSSAGDRNLQREVVHDLTAGVGDDVGVPRKMTNMPSAAHDDFAGVAPIGW